jgi:ornithine cyclodeaminase/alanine dehydrogenase-like protein (mu-crystallin family)
MKFIDEPTVAGVLRMQELVPLMKRTLIEFSQRRITQPTRRIIDVEAHGGYFASMAAGGEHAVGAKLVSFYPNNDKLGRPTHQAVIVLFNPETGEPLVAMDGRLITEMRTAAVTAAYVDAVAPKSADSLAILGAGLQGKSHIEALRCVRAIRDLRIWNRTSERAEVLARATGGRALDREAAVRGAEIVVVATSSKEPVLEGRWLASGATVASVGWAGRDVAELDAAVLAHTVIVDSRDGALAESGNIRLFKPAIHAELGEVLNGSRPVQPGTTTVFVSMGMACEDIAAATLVYSKLA